MSFNMATFYKFFNISYGQRDYTSKRFLEEHPGNVPLISSKGVNNGLYGFFDIKPAYEHVISVPRTGTIAIAHYHGYPCCIDDNCLVMKPKQKLSEREMIYFCLMVRANKFMFMYGRQVTPDRLGNLKISNKTPSWVHDIEIKNFDSLRMSKNKETQSEISPRNWKWFEIQELFTIKKGKRLTKANMLYGKTPFIGSINSNNGYREFVGQKPIHDGNTITVNYNGSVGEAFYQPKPFWASDDVNVLYPKFKMNRYIALFFVTLIRKEIFRFNYGRKWNMERMNVSKIKVPVDKQGMPDYLPMENYIKTLPFSKSI